MLNNSSQNNQATATAVKQSSGTQNLKIGVKLSSNFFGQLKYPENVIKPVHGVSRVVPFSNGLDAGHWFLLTVQRVAQDSQGEPLPSIAGAMWIDLELKRGSPKLDHPPLFFPLPKPRPNLHMLLVILLHALRQGSDEIFLRM